MQGEFDKKCPPYPFDDKILFINNEISRDVKFPCKTIRVDDYIIPVLDFFGLNADSFTKNGNSGFWYSIAELTAIYMAKDFDYLCWVQSDCRTKGDWITPGLKELDKKDISVVSPVSAVNTWHKRDGLDQFFSDQAYLIKVSEFRKKIYDYKEPYQPEYPFYGGASFEYKVGQYLKNNNKYRRILDKFWCEHG